MTRDNCRQLIPLPESSLFSLHLVVSRYPGSGQVPDDRFARSFWFRKPDYLSGFKSDQPAFGRPVLMLCRQEFTPDDVKYFLATQ